MIIYPTNKAGYDKVYSRIHIKNNVERAGENSFFSSYQIKSMRPKSAILISPKDLKSFIEDLKVLVDLGYDAAFKLTQTSSDQEIKKFIDITGFSHITKDVIKSFVEIEASFANNLYPEQIEPCEISFDADANTCQMSFAKFATRIGYLNDEFATIVFSKGVPEQVDEDNYGSVDKDKAFSLQMQSEHMISQVTNKPYLGTFNIAQDADANEV